MYSLQQRMFKILLFILCFVYQETAVIVFKKKKPKIKMQKHQETCQIFLTIQNHRRKKNQIASKCSCNNNNMWEGIQSLRKSSLVGVGEAIQTLRKSSLEGCGEAIQTLRKSSLEGIVWRGWGKQCRLWLFDKVQFGR